MSITYLHDWEKPVRLFDGTLVRVPVDEVCETKPVGYNTYREHRLPIHKKVCDFLGCSYSIFDQSEEEYYNVKKIKSRMGEMDYIVHRPMTKEDLFSFVESHFNDGFGSVSALLMYKSFEVDFIFTMYHVDVPAHRKFTCNLLRACGFAARDAVSRCGSLEAHYWWERARDADRAVTAAKEVCGIFDWAYEEIGEPYKIC